MKACFFTTSDYAQVLREQYTYADINILKDLGFDVQFANTLGMIPFNCDLYFSWWASGSVYPLIIAKLLNKPNIVVAGGNEAILYRDSVTNKPHGYLASTFFKKMATRWTLKHSTSVIAVSNFMTPGLIKLGCSNPHVIHNCVDTNIFCPDEDVTREFITTSFRLDDSPTLIKRGENFIKAAAILNKINSNLKFLIIGHKGNSFNKLKKLSDDLGLDNRLIFTGAIDNIEVVHYLQRSICFVQPSDTETFGVAVAEAMSVECPVVISNRGALSELAGSLGIYVDQNSAESIAEGVTQVLNMSYQSRSDLVKNLRIHIRDNFSYEKRKYLISKLIFPLVS